MQNSRKIPFVTITIALVITVCQTLRSMSGRYDEFILTNFDWLNWDTVYAQPWRIITSPFIHNNLLEFLVNLLTLFLFGWKIEPVYGRVKTLIIFFGALVAGQVLSITLAHKWIEGISNGVGGLFGFSLFANRRSPWWTTFTHQNLHTLYTSLIAISFLPLFFPFIADMTGYRFSHLSQFGGILYGLACGVVFLLIPQDSRWRWAVVALPFLLFASQFYSPWQLEWRLVNIPPTLLTSNADCRMMSIEPEIYTSANLTVVNPSTKRIALYWMDYEGKPRAYFWLKPGASDEYYPYIGHRWCIVDADSHEALQAITVTEPDQTITIR